MTAPSRGPHPEPPAEAEGRESEAAEDRPAAGTGAPGGTPAAEQDGEVRATGPDGAREEPASGASGASGSASEGPEALEDQPSASGSEAERDGPPEDTAAAEGEPANTADGTDSGDGNRETGQLSEAQAELAAQRALRAKIARRKAERTGPVAAGDGLSGSAAELLAAVRAVERGEKSGSTFYPAAAAAARPAGTAPPRITAPRTAPQAPATVAGPAPGAVAAARAVLARGRAPEESAPAVVEALGERAAAVLQDDPWRLLAVPGVGPEQADSFAQTLLAGDCGPGDPRRTAALIVRELERAALRGDTAVPSSAVLAALAGRAVPDPGEALGQAVADGTVLAFPTGADGRTEPAQETDAGPAGEGTEDPGSGEEAPAGPVLLAVDRYALAEESLADGLARLARSGPDPRWESVAEPTELTRALAAHGLVLHTGGEAARAEPAGLAGAARSLGLTAVVAVHSEQAARALGPDAVTVAALLAGAAGPGRDEDGAWALDLLVVLDAPRLGVEPAAVLVESLPDGARLVLGGDPGQLGPAGAGDVFTDLLASGVCPRIASRVPDPGLLGELVSGIGVGELNQVEAPGKEVVIVPVRDAGEAVHRTVQLVADSIPRAIGVPADRTQVITVAHHGSAGTRALNTALKARLNPGPGRFGGYDPGDRIAYTPAPGRTLPGTVVSADAAGLRLDCEGTAVTVARDRVGATLRHGWALTAHQAAALRWPAAVVVLPGDAVDALSRPWVYTAFGRAERHLSVVHGAEAALPAAVATIPSVPRTTRLRSLLTALLAASGGQEA
ncbi:helix-hairpin-helix domain-containing protein [Streptomyces sp. NPDC094448]|uniref:helix-hairpin-helix domain-containing protein n=1 Tax=Streptomyces sp. NPDC094448 TaxID=3366063 RepID=UPI0037FA4E12